MAGIKKPSKGGTTKTSNPSKLTKTSSKGEIELKEGELGKISGGAYLNKFPK